ncbi:protein ANTAGONIST OF LIKE HETEROCHROMATIN PROTEIN 1-like [Anopheles stephensi]|uniref:protein ANTAGONIST OF LIKE HETEROCHROMATIN PROTEIN 1-like n=1 Tax=Anopheles stephensi TaxID=30069 RepID=UPI0016588B08|nr:protein ANTAGONIST OF LIKE HETEROCHROMATIN PROTEIN 1-like [Anopheles stephensi]
MDIDFEEIAPALAEQVATLMMHLIEDEEEEEEESRPAKVRRCWTTDLFLEREDVWGRLLEAIDGEGPNYRIHDFLRLDREEFLHILSLIAPKICRENTNMRKAITPKQRLAIALRYLATGDSYESLAYLFRVSSRSVSHIVQKVCSCLIQDLKEYVKLPSSATEWLKTSSAFEEKWNFPHAIASIDGKHVSIKAPSNSGSQFFNYKKTFSIVLLAMVDANYNFLFVDVGCQGRISDGGVLANSLIYHKLERNELNIPPPEILQVPYQIKVPYYLLGDQAFAMKEYCLRPFGGMHAADSVERHFNYRHSRARRTVENAFGILSQVFRVFLKPIELEPPVAEKVVLAAVYLHNFRRRQTLYNFSDALLPPSTSQPSSSMIIEELDDVATPASMLPIPAIPIRPTRALQNMRTHVAHHLKWNDPLSYPLPQPRRAAQ